MSSQPTTTKLAPRNLYLRKTPDELQAMIASELSGILCNDLTPPGLTRPSKLTPDQIVWSPNLYNHIATLANAALALSPENWPTPHWTAELATLAKPKTALKVRRAKDTSPVVGTGKPIRHTEKPLTLEQVFVDWRDCPHDAYSSFCNICAVAKEPK